jgi:hypothetical protein
MTTELSAVEIEKVLDDWYTDLALDQGLPFDGVAETIAALVRSRTPQRTGGPEIAAELDRFVESWLEASPLVRAAVAGWLSRRVDEMVVVETKAGTGYAQCDLARRARIAMQGAASLAAISDLFIALCRQADDEADRLGVPGDARP